jgi:tRNA threonylcarbamoyladenosine biosynthesis protein TsaE
MQKMMSEVTLEHLPQVAQQIIVEGMPVYLWAFYGEMGAGKTTLVKEICTQLQVIDEVSSPTYSIVNEYKTKDGKTVFHFDFYRIKTIHEVYDIGYEDYFFSNNICLIEWPENIEQLLEHENVLRISIDKQTDNTRNIHLTLTNS